MTPLAKLMSENGITVTLTHLHVDWFDDEGKKNVNPMDKWYALIEYRGKSFGTFYSTGMGHRVFQKFPGGSVRWERKGDKYYRDGKLLSLAEMIKLNHLRLPKEGPKVDEVLHCLLNDSQSGSESFRDFCDNYGMDRDSLSGLKTYLACQETRDALIRMFGGSFLSQLIEAGQDM
jgi:hypothetical protein